MNKKRLEERKRFRIILRRRVNMGVAWLDEKKPRWENKIDLRRLSLRHGGLCICGQLFKSFWSVVISDGGLGRASGRGKYHMTEEQSISRGFYLGEGEDIYDNYDILTDIWFRKITRLRKRRA